MRDMRLDNTRNIIESFNGGYVFWYFDIVGDGTSKNFDFGLGFKNDQDSIINVAVNYSTHVDDANDYIQLKVITDNLSELGGIYAKFVWSIRSMEFKTLTGSETRYVVTALSKELDSPIIYDLGTSTKAVISYRAYRHITYTESKPYTIVRQAVTTPTVGNLEYTIGGNVTTVASTAITLDTFRNELLALTTRDELDIFITDDDGIGNATELMIAVYTSDEFRILHNVIGTVSDIKRSASISDLIKVRQGFDATIYEPVAISINDELSYQPYDVSWKLTNSNGDIVETSTDYVFKFWTKLPKHVAKDDLTLDVTWKDKYGTEYIDKFPSIFMLWRTLVDKKYETFNGLTDEQFHPEKQSNMWILDGEENKPKWYLPIDQKYANITITKDNLVEGSALGGPVWLMSNGVWLDFNYWID
jgi:hypothetical protein